LLTEPGLRIILVQRQREYDVLASPALWMSMGLALIGSAIVVAIAPLVAHFYQEPRLLNLLFILALRPLLENPGLVCSAKLSIDMRFRALSVIDITATLFSLGLTVILAALGFGAYSFAIPVPATAALRTIIYWWMAPCRVNRRPQFPLIRTLYKDTATLLGTRFFQNVIRQGDYIVLGFFYDAQVVGIYYFAFTLSLQVIQLFQTNLTRVLFPALSSIQHDAKRQARAFLKVTSLLAIAAIPFAFLQTGLADPLIHLIFAEKWWPAVLPLQILSIGMGIRVVGALASPMMQAQGRYRTQLLIILVTAPLFLLAVIIVAQFGEAAAVAVVVMFYSIIGGTVNIYIAGWPNTTWKDIAQIEGIPMIVASVLLAASMFLASLVGPETFDWFENATLLYLTRAIIVLTVFVPTYTLTIRRWRSREYNEILGLARSLMRRRA
jgi:PST family polysaccharide transporter